MNKYKESRSLMRARDGHTYLIERFPRGCELVNSVLWKGRLNPGKRRHVPQVPAGFILSLCCRQSSGHTAFSQKMCMRKSAVHTL